MRVCGEVKCFRISRFRLSKLFAGLTASVVAPAGRAENILPSFFPADVAPGEIFSYRRPFVEDEVDGAGFFHWRGEAVFPGLVFFGGEFRLEGAEELVPNDQEHAHILIEVFGVGSVMYPMVRRGDQDIFEPAHFVDQFGMHKNPPNLRRRVHKYNIDGPEAEAGERNEVDEPVEGLEDRGTEAHCKIHFFRGMMGDMDSPEKADLMIPAMQPVIQEVFGQQEQEPIGENISDRDPVVVVAELEDQQVDAAEQEVDETVEEHQVNIAKGVLKGIELSVPVIAEQNLQADDDKI